MCWQARQFTSGGNSPSGTGAQGPVLPQIAVPGSRVMNPILTAWSVMAW
jgi:hypothetical protein